MKRKSYYNKYGELVRIIPVKQGTDPSKYKLSEFMVNKFGNKRKNLKSIDVVNYLFDVVEKNTHIEIIYHEKTHSSCLPEHREEKPVSDLAPGWEYLAI